MRTIGIFFFLFTLVAWSCTRDMREDIYSNSEETIDVEIVPLEDALQYLEEFLAETNMPPTKSGSTRKIATTETHYSKTLLSKSGESLPDAYIVNFENGEGFAVLGANTSVSSIVAVTYSGSLEEGFLDKIFTTDSLTVDVDGNEIDLSDFDFYSEEYDDYYVMVNDNNEQFMQYLILDGIEGSSGGGSSGGYATVEPMLNTKWEQGEWNKQGVYNQYCYKYTLFGKKKYVLTGCSTTAMASIVAYNEFPPILLVLKDTVDLSTIKTIENANSCADSSATDIGLLMGSIFHSVNPLFVLEAGTCITPAQIKKCMKKFKYSDVEKLNASSFNSTLKSKTSKMLKEGKPVFISAMSGLSGHAWVIDGAKYSGTTWMVNCIWGWKDGRYNGYYSSNCFNPAGEKYTWHFRVITYSIPEYNDENKDEYKVEINF